MQVSCGQEYNVSWLWAGIQVGCGQEYKLAVSRNTVQLLQSKNIVVVHGMVIYIK